MNYGYTLPKKAHITGYSQCATKHCYHGSHRSGGFSLAVSLAEHNTVYAVARFTDESSARSLSEAGIVCIAANLGDGDFGNIPLDADYLLNFAVNREVGNDFEAELCSNTESLALLMQHCQRYRCPPCLFLRRLSSGAGHRSH